MIRYRLAFFLALFLPFFLPQGIGAPMVIPDGGNVEWNEYEIFVPETGKMEKFGYIEPTGYSPGGPPHPMIVGWHAFAVGYKSLESSSLVSACEDRNWILMAHTGIDSKNFGSLEAQIHCTAAIDHLVNQLGLNIDTKRIYMAGLSMGGAGAASYACRHMATGEGFPVAGVVLVASALDWTYAYDQGDQAVQQYLPVLLGGTPDQVPFKYKQISALFIDMNIYQINESMGRNLLHNIPVFHTYAGNDPVAYQVKMNHLFRDMMIHKNGNYMLDYDYMSFHPHDWGLLDAEAACDFIGQFSLDTRTTDHVAFLADRDARWFWSGVIQDQGGAFSLVEAETEPPGDNRVSVLEATNTSTVLIDPAEGGLSDDEALYLHYEVDSPASQSVAFQPVDKPAYVVDLQGIYYPDFAYNTGEERLTIQFEPSVELDLKVSFEEYKLTLVSDDSVPLGGSFAIHMEGGGPFEKCVLFLGFSQQEKKFFKNHTLLLLPYFWLFGVLDGAGIWDLPIYVPKDPALKDLTLYQQYLTYDKGVTGVSNLDWTLFYE